MPDEESSINVKSGSRKLETKVSSTFGRKCNVAARVWDMLMYSIGAALAAFCAFQA